jgi:hypothetical protein
MFRLLCLPGLLTLCAAFGCSSDRDVPSAPVASATPASPATETASNTGGSSAPVETTSETVAGKLNLDRENIGFKTGSGERLYEIKFKDDGAKLVDPDEQEIARFNVDEQKVKIKLPDESVAAYVVVKDGEFQIRDESQKVELFELKGQSDGDWKLKDGDDKVLAVIKKRDYGYEIEDSADNSLFKSKLKGDKRSLRNAKDETVLYSKDDISPLSVACLGLEQIESLPVRAGLAAAVLLYAK